MIYGTADVFIYFEPTGWYLSRLISCKYESSNFVSGAYVLDVQQRRALSNIIRVVTSQELQELMISYDCVYGCRRQLSAIFSYLCRWSFQIFFLFVPLLVPPFLEHFIIRLRRWAAAQREVRKAAYFFLSPPSTGLAFSLFVETRAFFLSHSAPNNNYTNEEELV